MNLAAPHRLNAQAARPLDQAAQQATRKQAHRPLATSEGSTGAPPANVAKIEQLTLPGCTTVTVKHQTLDRSNRSQRRDASLHQVVEDPLVTRFRERLEVSGAATGSQTLYLRHVRAVARLASCIAGRAVTWQELIDDADLLGRALADDISPTLSGKQLSRWTMASRRSAVRKFIELLRQELAEVAGKDPDTVLDSALRSVAEPVGLGFRLNGGAPRRRGGYVPTAEQVAAILSNIGQAEGFRGLRNRAFFHILAESGARVNALRGIDGKQVCVMPDGTIRMFLHEKRKAEQREIELSGASGK